MNSDWHESVQVSIHSFHAFTRDLPENELNQFDFLSGQQELLVNMDTKQTCYSVCIKQALRKNITDT